MQKTLDVLYFIVCAAALLVVAVQQTSNENVKLHGDEKFIPNPQDLININGSLYYISSFNGTYFEAVRTCNDFNMKLISIPTEEKQQVIYSYLNENNISSSIWTSGIRVVSKTFIWSGIGVFFDHTNWFEGQPDALSTTVDVCMYLGGDSHQWFDTVCGTPTLYFICEEIYC